MSQLGMGVELPTKLEFTTPMKTHKVTIYLNYEHSGINMYYKPNVTEIKDL